LSLLRKGILQKEKPLKRLISTDLDRVTHNFPKDAEQSCGLSRTYSDQPF